MLDGMRLKCEGREDETRVRLRSDRISAKAHIPHSQTSSQVARALLDSLNTCMNEILYFRQISYLDIVHIYILQRVRQEGGAIYVQRFFFRYTINF